MQDYPQTPHVLIDAEWRPVVGYEGLYEVSSSGQVRSLDRTDVYLHKGKERRRKRKGGMRKPYINKLGYSQVLLAKGKPRKNASVHRLVAEAFIPNPENKPEVHHINEDKSDNRVENLMWCTSSENSSFSVWKTTGSRCGTSKLKEEDVKEIKVLLSVGIFTQREIAARFGVHYSTISKIAKGHNWGWL